MKATVIFAGYPELSPTFASFVKQSDLSSAGTEPTIRNCGDGSYDFEYPTLTEPIKFCVDGGDTLGSELSASRCRWGIIYPTDGAIVTTVEPTGAYRVSFYVKDGNNNPIPNVSIRLYTSPSGNPVRTITNLEDGNSEVINLDGVNYTIIASRSGYIFHTFTATPSGNGVITITGTQIVDNSISGNQWNPV